MVAIVTGKGVGLERSSAWVLGSNGQIGSPSQGRAGEDVFVNAATGNLVITRHDEFLIGRGPDVSIDRTYNSQGDLSDDNGDNWRMGVYRKVTGLSGTYGASGSTVKRIDWDGSDTLYTWNATYIDSTHGAYVATDGEGAYDMLVRASGVWTWTDGTTQITESYDDNNGGRITARTDTDGNGLTYSYTGNLITRVTNSNGAATDDYTDMVYGGTGGNQLLKLETHAGGTLTRIYYTYDAYNRLSQVKVNLNPTDNSDTSGTNYTTTYTYTDTTGKRVASITQSDGSLIQVSYVLVGSTYKVSALSQRAGWGFDRVTTFSYQTDSTIVTDTLGQRTTLFYDANKNLVRIVLPADTAGTPRIHSFTYNSNGDLLSASLGQNDMMTYSYDAHGNLLTQADRAGDYVVRTYDSKNHMLTERRYVTPYTSSGETGTPMTTRYAYDTLGHLRYVVTPEGFVTEHRYETNPANLGHGERIATIDYAANAYDVSGLAYNATISESALNTWVAGIGDKSTTRRTQFEYDYRGNLAAEKSYSKLLSTGLFDTSSELSQTTYVYDQAGNLLSKLVNGSTATETFLYDGLNRIVSSTDFNNVTTTVAFNDAARSTIVSLANGLVQTSLFGYAGELLTYTESGTGISAGNSFVYDGLGRLVVKFDALWQPEIYLYDALGQKVASVDSDGSVTEYRYDARGDLSSTTAYANRLSAEMVAYLADDPTAYPLVEIIPLASADDRWTWQVHDDAHRLVQTIDGTGATTIYAYDAASRLVSTKQYATPLSQSVVAGLKAAAVPYNILTIEDEEDWGWTAPGLTVASAGWIDGYAAYKFTGNGYYDAIDTIDEISAYAGDVLTMSVSMLAVGTNTTHDFGIWTDWESPYEWGFAMDVVIMSGPGTLTKLSGGQYRISGLSTTEATRLAMVRTFTSDQLIRPRFWLAEWNAQQMQHYTGGLSIILAGPVMTRTQTGVTHVPATDAANDRVSRNFYDRDGRLTGTLDAEGYLTQIVYDKAGRKIRTIAYSGATATTYRASGTFAQLLGSVTVDNARDIRKYFVYDARGMLRAEIDGEGDLTRYAYTPLGDISETVTGQKLDPATLLTTPPTFANLPAAPSGTILETTSYTRNHYGQPLTETKSLTGSTSTVTTYVYDSMRRLVSTITQSGGPDPRIASRRYDLRGRLVRELSGIGSAMLEALGPNPDEELSEPIWTNYGTLYGYDEADRLIARVDANGARTLYYYDADDRLAYQVDALGAVIEYRYDAFGARTDTIVYAARIDIETFVEMTGGAAADVAGIVAALANPVLDQRSTAQFDLAGRTRASRDPLGNVTLSAYNSFGELVSETVPLESGIAAPAIVTADFSFEAPETGTAATYNPTVSGVTFASKSGVVGNGNGWGFAAAPDGDQVAFVQSNSTGTGAITMTVTGLNAGTVYQLSFMLAKRASVAANPLLVSIDGQVYGYMTPSSTSFTQVNLGPFQAQSGSATITFAGTQSSSERMSAIDKVIVTQATTVPHSSFEVPEVGTGSQYNPSIGMATFESKAGVAGNGSSWGFAAAPDGDQVAFLQSNSGGTGSISETLTNLIPGRSYQLSFYLAKRSGANANPVTVSVDGLVLGTFTPGSTSFAQFTASAFQAIGTTATLSFIGDPSATEKVSALDKLAIVQLASNSLQTSFAYDRRGQVKTQIVDAAPGGKAITTTYGYDAFGRSVQLTDPAGEVTATAYDRAGRVLSTTDALDGVTSFTYDARGNLVAVIDALNHVTRYVYDNAGRRIFAVDALGGVVETGYDGDGRVVATRAYANPIFVFGLELAAADITAQLVQDSGDRVTRNAYDKDGRLRFMVDGTLGLTEYGYDDAGNRLRTIRHDWSVSPASTWTIDDLQAEVDAHATEPQRVSRAVFDAAGRMTFTIDPVGNVVAFSYDSAGRVIKQVAFVTAYQGGEDPLDDAMQSWAADSADAGDRVGRAVYDRKGRLVYSVDAEGFVTEYRYNKRDSVVKEIRYADPYTVSDGASPASLAAQIGALPWSAIVTDFVYDSAGRLAETVDGLGHRTVMTLDQRGQILSSTIAYGTGDAVTATFVYDALGRLESETHAAGAAGEQTTTYAYDALDQRVSTTHAAGTAAEWTVTQSYDALGRLKREMSGIGSALLASLGPNPDAELADPIWAEYATQYGYDTAGRLVARSDSRGARTLYYYDAADRLAYEVDALGDVLEHRYNALGDCIEIIRYAARIDAQTFSEMAGGDVADIAGTVNALANAALDQAGHFEFNLDGTIQRSTDPLGEETSYVYNAFGDVVLRSDPLNSGTAIETSFGYDRRGHLTTRIVDSAAGGKQITTTYGYDAFGRRVVLIDPNEQYTVTSYDQNGRVVQITDAFDNTTYFTYDARGNLVAVEDPMGQVTRYVYDQADRRIFAVDALGGVVETSYDEADRAVATRAYASAIPVYGFSLEIAAADVTEQLIADSGDRITRNAYDKDGRLRFMVDGTLGLTEYRYDDAGNRLRTIGYGWTVSPASTWTMDDLQAEVDAHAADPQRVSRAVYDAAGRMTFAIDAAGNVAAFSYDSAGRVIKQVAFVTAYPGSEDPLDDVMRDWATTNAHADDRVGRAVYDRKGRMVYSIDAEGFVTEYRFDKRDNVVKEVRYADPYTVADDATPAAMAALLPSSVPASAIVTDFVYDSAGRLAETVDGLGHRTVITLDQRGQILSSTIADGTGDAVTTTRSYDALGRLESETRAAGTADEQTTLYAYDVLGELVSITHAAGTAAEWTTTRGYDALGRLKREMSGIGSALLASLGPWPDPELADPIWAEYATQFGYDTAGRMVARSDAVGARTLYYYDTVGRLVYEVDAKGVVVEYRYNPLGDRTDTIRYAARIDAETFSEMVGGDAVDIAGTVNALADAALDERRTATFDSAGRMILNAGQLGAYTAYSYNSFGEVELRKVALGESASPGVATEIATSFAYDRRGKLETEIVDAAAGGKAITTTHAYDAFGREVVLTDPENHPLTTEYDQAGRIVSTTDALENTTFYTYDARGNLVAVKDALNNVTRYVYDHADHLIFTVDALGGVVETSYDGDDHVLVSRAYAGSISTFGLDLQITAGDVTAQLIPGSSDRITRNAYDKDGRLRFTVDGVSGLTEYRYDDVGHAIRTIRYDWAVSSASAYTMDDLQAEVDAHAADPMRVTRAVYDAAGRMTFAIDAAGNVTAFSYDSAGRVIKQVAFVTAYQGGEDPLDDVMRDWATTNAHPDDRVSRAVYDRDGRLVYSIDAESFVTEYRHNRQGDVVLQIRYADPVAVEDGATPASVAALLPSSVPQSAITTEYFYDSAGRLEKTRDALLNWTVMTLDQRGQILSTTVAHGTSDASTTTRSYDELGRLHSETRAAGAAEESTTVYGYNVVGELETITYAAGTTDECLTTRTYDAAGQLKTETRADGKTEEVTTVYGYNAFGDMESTTAAAGTVDEQVTTRVYDALGRVESETVADGSAAEATTFYAYNAFGNVAKVTDPRLNSAYFYYDARDRLILQVDQEGYATRSVYELGSEPVSVTRYATRTQGATIAAPPEIVADPDADATTVFHYDKLDRLTDVTDAEEHSEHYELDAQGNRTQIVNKLNGVTDNVYDLLGRLKTQIVHANVHDSNGTLVATAIQTDFDYDRRGNLKTRTEGVGLGADVRVTSYAYDKLDQLIEIDRPDIVSVTVGLFMDPLTMQMKDSFAYDRRGNVIASQVAGAPNTYSYYDHLNRKTDEIDQSGMLSHWDYDANGNVKAHRVYGDAVAFAGTRPSAPPSPVNSANFRETHYTYDKANRLETSFGASLTTARWDGDSYDFATGAIVRHVEYDAAGNAIRDYVGDVETRSFYDKLGRKIGQLDPEHYLTVWELDAEGNVLVETRHANKVTGTIDQNAGTQALHAAAGSSVDDRITVSTYDRNGRRETETRLEVVASTTVAGTLATTLHAASQIQYDYNGFGQVTRKVEANGDETLFTYDDFGRLTRTEAPAFAGHLGASVRPTTDNLFDAFGNVVRTTLNDPNGAAGDARVTSYVYNQMGWLASMTHQIDATLGTTHSYTYDAGGRIVWDQYSRRKSNGTNSPDSIVYTYDVSGRLLSQAAATRTTTPPAVPKWGFGDVSRFKYNVFGEMIGRGINFGADNLPLYQETFDYDEGGRLWRSTEGGSGKIMFHDALGNVTLTLSSAGANVGAIGFDTAKSSILVQGGSGDTNIGDAVTTIGVFDKRGLQIATIEPDRQLSSAAGTVTISSSRTLNAFGEATSETDARNNTTLLFYNTMGRLIRKESPEVSWTDQNGVQANVHPTEHYFYDISGRLVAVTDANGHTTRRNLLAGTGHDGAEALVTVEYHADDRKVQTLYDVFKDARISRNEYWIDNSSNNDPVKTDVLMAYDKLGRLIQVQHLGRLLTETFTYDQLGQRTGHTMNALTETTDYDRQGRVIKQVAFGGDTTTYSYAWDGTITPGSLGNLGGWLKTTINAATVDSSVTLDYFNRTIARSDFGDHVYSHGYDWAGRMTSMAGPGETLTYTYLNSGRLASISNGAGNSTAFGYDKAGNETSEVTYKNSQLVQNASATWDALGRMASWAEAGTTTLPTASILYEYDRVGNIRRQKSSFQRLDGAGAPTGFLPTQDNWYLYDVMDRVTRDRGILVAVVSGELKTGDDARGIGTIERQQPGVLTSLNRLGEIGYDYTYDEAGRRMSMAMSKVRYEGGFPQNAFFREHKEMYDYFADGSLQQVRWVDGAETGFANSNTITVPAATGSGIRLSEFTRDAFGRTTSQTDWLTATVRGFSRTGIVYDDKGQILSETVTNLASENNADALYVNQITNEYGTGADYRLGAVVSSTSTVTRNDNPHSNATTTNTYEWRDAPVITSALIHTSRQAGGVTDYTTNYHYGASSDLTFVDIHDGRPRDVNFINDMAGQVIRRDETGGTSSGAPHEIWYRFGGKQMGQVSNNGTLDNDYQQSLVYRQIWLGDSEGLGAFRFGGNTPKTYADFSQSQSPINSYEQGGAGGSYIVRSGDTLQSIAASLWGNTDLWYKLAEANGLSGNSALVEGTSLTVPPAFVSNAHNADTFRPYDAAKALGDLSPSAQKPPPKPGGCGMIGQLIIMAIAIAITLIIKAPVAQIISRALQTAVGLTSAAATAVGAVVGAAVTGAVASAVSQGVGVATGLQEKFSWKGVALSALSAGVTEGFAQAAGAIATSAAKAAAAANTTVSTAGKVAAYLAGNAVGAQVVRSVVTDVASQGIAVATGLQKKFDWAGIAANAAGAAVGAFADKRLGRLGVAALDRRVAANFASGIARAGTRAALTGTSFSDNVGAELPGVFANTIGLVIQDAMERSHAQPERNILVDGAPEMGIPSLRDYLRTHRPDGSLIENPFDLLKGDLRIDLPDLEASIASIGQGVPAAPVLDDRSLFDPALLEPPALDNPGIEQLLVDLPTVDELAGPAASRAPRTPEPVRHPQVIVEQDPATLDEATPAGRVYGEFEDYVAGGIRMSPSRVAPPWHEIFESIEELPGRSQFMDLVIERNGGAEAFSGPVFEGIQRWGQETSTTSDRLRSFGGQSVALADQLDRRQAIWDGEHPIRATLWGFAKFTYGAASSLYETAETLVTYGTPGGMTRQIAYDLAHPEEAARRPPSYIHRVFTGQANPITDIRDAFSRFGTNISTTYQLGGLPAVINRYGEGGGRVATIFIPFGTVARGINLVRGVATVERAAPLLAEVGAASRLTLAAPRLAATQAVRGTIVARLPSAAGVAVRAPNAARAAVVAPAAARAAVAAPAAARAATVAPVAVRGTVAADRAVAPVVIDAGVGSSRLTLAAPRFAAPAPAQFGVATSSNYRATFLAANQRLPGPVVVHHAVERQVLVRYPGLVTPAELHSLENLRGIPTQLNPTLHLRDIRREWDAFYRRTPNPTQQQLLDQATRIDDMYGHLFWPPVR